LLLLSLHAITALAPLVAAAVFIAPTLLPLPLLLMLLLHLHLLLLFLFLLLSLHAFQVLSRRRSALAAVVPPGQHIRCLHLRLEHANDTRMIRVVVMTVLWGVLDPVCCLAALTAAAVVFAPALLPQLLFLLLLFLLLSLHIFQVLRAVVPPGEHEGGARWWWGLG
jgi:hypothetical protein